MDVTSQQLLDPVDHSIGTNFDDFLTPATTPWNPYRSLPDIAQPLMPYEPEVNFNLISDAGLNYRFETDPLQPWSFVPEAGFMMHSQHNSPQAIAPPLAPPATNPVRPRNEERHTCPVCNKTSKRAGDYRRHMKKHAPPLFRCCVINCDKTFYRADKVRDHLKQGHKWNY
ncbi:hypothetical protein FB567DRAFT_529055 [Paraphoma chrysanthemicola]|uniref:C2H2-type domain-containing protein n=1 Tax=Paraphoma chrysanthemicola TaxID=798071 RepID=A0A8K0R3Q0_9PLEO|nr:hypothetical protein FB567DRAFT_529055 [Paraphoma chrysanthemicola]